MKKSLIFVGMLAIGFANAQEGNVGINTDNPKATLDIQPNATNLAGNTNEGILAPRLSKARVANIVEPVQGTMVYVLDENTVAYPNSLISSYTGSDAKVAKITEKGYYFYNGTEWVKVQYKDNSDFEWVRDSNSGVDKIYMRNVLIDDEISYRKDKGYYGINLGGIKSTDIDFPLDESPNYTFISSSKLPSTAQRNKFYFNKNISLLKNEHLVANSGREYTGNLFRLETKNVTSTQESASALEAQLYHTGVGKLKYPTGLSVGTTIDGTNGASAAGSVYGLISTARTVANATADKLVGIWGYVNNIVPTVGKAKLSQMVGIASEVNSTHPGNTGNYASAELGNLFGYKTDVTNNPNSKTDSMRGLQTILTFQRNSEIIGRAVGVDAYALIDRDAKIKEYSGIVSNIDNISGAATITSLHGMRIQSNIHADSQIQNMYGLKIESIKKGNKNNYSIFTDEGKIRLGDLAQSGAGDRVVYADENGVLKAGVAASSNVKLATTNNVECTEANTGTMNFGSVTINGKATEAFGFCMKNSTGEYKWYYIYGGAGITTGSGAFGSNL